MNAEQRASDLAMAEVTDTEVTDTEVVIVGAGPVGLALALALAHRSIRSVVLDAKARLDEHSRATLLPPRALEILADVGVLPALVDAGQVNPALDIRRPGDLRSILRFDFDAWSPVRRCRMPSRSRRIAPNACCSPPRNDVPRSTCASGSR